MTSEIKNVSVVVFDGAVEAGYVLLGWPDVAIRFGAVEFRVQPIAAGWIEALGIIRIDQAEETDVHTCFISPIEPFFRLRSCLLAIF